MSLIPLLLLVSQGGLELPAQFSDHMVLQRETTAPFWGRAAPGREVSVRCGWDREHPLTARADAQGAWRVDLKTPVAGGPHEILVRAGEERTLRDVWIGEVWIASGQSNMEWTLGPRIGNGVEGSEEAIRTSGDPQLRFFEVKNVLAAAPRRDVRGSWITAGPETSGAFSAVAYFFARRLRAELGVPVGIVSTEWGGTPVEAWTRAEALAGFPEFASELEREAAFARDPRAAEEAFRDAAAAFWKRASELDATRGLAGAERPDFSDSTWASVELPTPWEKHGLESFDGLAWYRRTLELPADWAGKGAVLELGPIDDRDTVYWNGERIGGQEEDTAWQTPRRYVVPRELVRAGTNLLAVRVLDTGGLGGFSGPAAALKLTREDGQATLSMAGTWRWRAGTPLSELGNPPVRDAFSPGAPSVLWNGMVAPLVPSAIRGVIWYQGEANVGRDEQYARLFPNLIRDWRAAWGRGEFPFYYVQLAPFGYGGDQGQAARLRDVQRRTLAVPGTGMAVTMDIGNPRDIHPLKKREVGDRLALWALARTYGRTTLECSGPLYASARAEGAALRVTFEHAQGLTSRGEPVRHLTIAGEDRAFHPAEGRIEGESLVVSSPEVPHPVAVRFGWGAADETNLWNAAGLPAASFRTDDWP